MSRGFTAVRGAARSARSPMLRHRRGLFSCNLDGVLPVKWSAAATIPARSDLLDAGLDWVLLLERGEFDEQSVAVYELVERGDAG